jgi:diguanylate cyclase (GGDEF)-like protein
MVPLPKLRELALQQLNDSNKAISDKTIHELQVHQIELEMQQHELIQINHQLELTNKKYIDLYDFSPAGLMTINCAGKIINLNLTCSTLLNSNKLSIINNYFVKYVDSINQDQWSIFLQNVKYLKDKSIELKLNLTKDTRVLIQCVHNITLDVSDDIDFALTDITAQSLREEAAISLQHCDKLTGLPNKQIIIDRIEQEMLHSNRNRHYSVIMFVDLDKFKSINDQYGHEAGDTLIIETAKRLSQCVRESDTVARVGGDEFVILLDSIGQTPELAKSQANEVAEKIFKSILTPFRLLTNSLTRIDYILTLSMGVIIFTNSTLGDASQLLKQADAAMYRAKQVNGNSMQFYSE